MTALVLYDDAVARELEPFALTRPACELRAGALLLRERWERAVNGGRQATGVVAAQHLASFDEPWGVGVVTGVIRATTVIANSRCAVALADAPEADVWTCDGAVAAVRLARDVDAAELADGTLALEALAPAGARQAPLRGRWLARVWDFIGHLPAMLSEDAPVVTQGVRRLGRDHAHIQGPHAVFFEAEANIEPQVFFDTTAGPVLVRRGATVMAFTRIVGPCVIGPESLVGGDKIAMSSIGDVCKVHGEVNSAVFLGHANKSHEGFVGHSYLGRWVNLGAGTITSNLKNTYGSVHLWTVRGEMDTGLQFLGTIFGDHAKTGIGATLTTGTVVGAAANIFGARMSPKCVPPFAWGEQEPYDTYDVEKFLQVTERVMARRHVALSPRARQQLAAAFARRWTVTNGGRS